MNYRTMVKGALALSLSLIVGSSWAGDSQQYGATFEQTPVGTVENDFAYTEGDGITNAKYRVTQDVEKPYGWFSGSEEGDESKIVARTDAAGGHALQLNTDANTLTNQLAKSVAEKLNNVLAGENGETQGVVYFETDVKFVASDTDDAGIKGNTDATKFAIYAYCKDDVPEGQEVTTNLVVYHAYQYVDENDDIITDFTNEVFKSVSIDTEVYTKLRIEMKKLEVDEGAYQNVFSVSINGGDPISSATALDKVLDPTAPGIWFQTVEDAIGGANNAKVAALNFKGTGAIDNIKAGVIEEAQPLDDNWTIEGFNSGNNRWPLPTAVAADSKTLFYSNLVVNIDPVGDGRTIPAAWVGAKVTASEAAAADLSAWNFEYDAQDGTRKTYAFNAAKDGEDYLYWWVPITAAEVRTAIANQSDIVKTMVVYTSSTSGADAQTLTVSICPKNIEITNTDDVEGGETIEVNDWIENVPAPTVITVAQTIGAHGSSVSNGNFQAAAGIATPITITADQGYVVAQIITNGAPVADALGETSVTFDAVFSDAEGANNSIIATFAKENAWFIEPFVRNTFRTGYLSQNSQAAALDEANDMVAFGTGPGASNGGIVQYSLADLTNDFGKVTASEFGIDVSGTQSGEYWGRSFAAVPPFQALISCNHQNANVVVSPYGGPWATEGDVSYTVAFDMGESGLSSPKLYPIAVNKAGTFLYGSDKAGAKIYKFAIVADTQDNTKIGSLQYVNSWTLGYELKGIGVGTFNGNDVVYVGYDGTRGVRAFNVATETFFDVAAPIDCQVYDIIVTGQADGTPRLIISGNTRTFVYDLNSDGSLMFASPVAKYANASFFKVGVYGRYGVAAVDDDSRIMMSAASDSPNQNQHYASVIEKKPANLIVRGTFDQGVTTDDRSVAFGAAASETFTAPAGETLISVTVNGVAQQVAEGATSFTYEAAELNQYVYIDMQSSPPVYTATWTGSENVIVTNANYEMDPAIFSTDVTQGTVLSFYPTEGNVITNVTIGGVAQTGFDPACYSITVVSDTNLVVLAGASAADDYTAGDTVGAETLNADVAAWLNTKKGTATKVEFEKTLDGDSLTLAEEYLLNTDPTVDTTVEFKISSIAVGDTVDLQVTLTRTEGNEAVTAAINGELQIVGATSLDGTFGNGEAVNATFEGATTAAKSLTTQAKFFKAVIVQKSAQAGN